ncbi:MAG: hypothetical protein R3F35_15590 [Myxococcota bacterium]
MKFGVSPDCTPPIRTQLGNAREEAVEGPDARRPAVRQRGAPAPDDLAIRAACVVRSDLEARHEDEAIDRMLAAGDDDGLLRDRVDAAAVGIDQRHVRSIEGLEVGVVEARSLAELAIPGLERLGRLRIAHDPIDARPDRLHLAEVGELDLEDERLGRARRAVAPGQHARQVAHDVGPTVAHEIDVEDPAREGLAEVPDPLRLPAGRERTEPIGVRRGVASGVDRRGRSLEDEEMPGPLAEMRDALDRRRPGPDDADALVGEAREPTRRIAAGIGVVPATGVERMPFEDLDAGIARELGAGERVARDDHEARSDRIRALRSPRGRRQRIERMQRPERSRRSWTRPPSRFACASMVLQARSP